MGELRPKQKLFADEYLKDLNATRAAIDAGYSRKTAYSIANENLNKPEIKAYIAQKQQEIAKKNELSVSWVLQELKDTYAACRSAIAVLDHEGNETGEYRFEANASIRALELLGKHVGMFNTKIDIGGGEKPILVATAQMNETIDETLDNVLTKSIEEK